MPGKLGTDIRQKHYQRAIHRLEGVARGTIKPDLPPTMSDETETAANAFILSADTTDHNIR